jgi:DNA repair protein RadC
MSQTISEINISYKPSPQSRKMNPILSSADAYGVLKHLYNQDLICAREEFIVIYLNNSGRVLGHFRAFTGGITSVTCDLRIILGVGLKSLSASIILSHNHPSGNLKPSKSDLNLTQRIHKACKLLDLQLFDHILISEEGYYSFADDGLLIEQE